MSSEKTTGYFFDHFVLIEPHFVLHRVDMGLTKPKADEGIIHAMREKISETIRPETKT